MDGMINLDKWLVGDDTLTALKERFELSVYTGRLRNEAGRAATASLVQH